ncbi:L-aspartate oxidase [Aquibacillus albus]|uniref:L-aspartate oxidase n=1 Tax=Aquibacillus albus TaxID=1168171 RepID=A0ABS2N1N2_9BACI|nr:L-aspartate oxidase [Aquibacillus albus]
MITIEKENVVIIGSGLAALTIAERLSGDKNVIVLTKSTIHRSNSVKAQGGIAASVGEGDHWESHYQDTMTAGCFFNEEQAVEVLVKKGPHYIKKLMDRGLPFDKNAKGELLLGKEGAHMHRRILHAGGDATGNVLMDFLIKHLQISVIEGENVLDLIMDGTKCVGVITSNKNGNLNYYTADHVILATGGCGGLYQVTSNDSTTAGDGIALAYRAGAELNDLEFMQFHPTMLYTNNRCYGLVSEAVRGEGAVLKTKDGKPIMERVHPLKDLAPRDIVAREIQTYLNNGETIYLDISMIEDFQQKFPTITSICEKANIFIENGLLPVAPGAHFLMGGVKTNLYGETNVEGLYAIGEVACNGVHGANRLASNSLLEGIVFSNLLADRLLSFPGQSNTIKQRVEQKSNPSRNHLELPSKEEIQEVMTRYVGIERSREGLLFAKQWMERFNFQQFNQKHISDYTNEQLEKINQLTSCWLIITSALMRTESRGGHYRSDYPKTNDLEWGARHIIRHKNENRNKSLQMTGVES